MQVSLLLHPLLPQASYLIPLEWPDSASAAVASYLVLVSPMAAGQAWAKHLQLHHLLLLLLQAEPVRCQSEGVPLRCLQAFGSDSPVLPALASALCCLIVFADLV